MPRILSAMASLVIATASVVPTIAQAETTDSVRVSYADLDLVSPVGRDRLERRVAYAAASVCGPADQRDLIYWKAVTTCRTGAIADAQPAFEMAVAAARHPSVTVMGAAAVVVVTAQ